MRLISFFKILSYSTNICTIISGYNHLIIIYYLYYCWAIISITIKFI